MRVHPDERRKKHHAKSRLGCLSCKRRHLKCDEARPSCSRCIGDFGKCDGYDIPKTWVFQPLSSGPTTVAAGGSSDGSPISNSASSSYRTGSISGSSQSSKSPNSSQGSFTSPEAEHSRQKRWAPKSKSGCTTCKKRRVKCDEKRPACSRCMTTDRQCEYATAPKEEPAEETLPVPATQRRKDPDKDRGHIAKILHICNSPYKTQAEYQTFVHWQSRTESCMVMSRSFGDFNILGGALPQAAWSYDCLRHGLLSAASVTASIEKFSLGEFNERQAVIEAVKQSSLAISSIFNEKPPPEVTVLVAFVFWFMEAWMGSWDRAVMHLESAARMCEQSFPKGEVSEAVAWYVAVCDAGVPEALRTPEILQLVQNVDDVSDENFQIRLLWSIREAADGVALLQQARKKARQVRSEDSDQFDAILATHQAQMKFMSERWQQHAKLQLTVPEQDLPSPPKVPTYSKIMEMVDYFVNNDERYDSLVLAVYLKMIQRSLPLFAAGKNMEIRRDAALSIPIKIEPLEPGSQIHEIAPDMAVAAVS